MAPRIFFGNILNARSAISLISGFWKRIPLNFVTDNQRMFYTKRYMDLRERIEPKESVKFPANLAEFCCVILDQNKSKGQDGPGPQLGTRERLGIIDTRNKTL